MSQFPADERSNRDVIESALNREHDMASPGSGRHKFGVGNATARDAITDWVVGSVWLLNSSSPATLQRVVSVGPVVWESVTQSPADDNMLWTMRHFMRGW